jgi:3-deoxy-manno-octulosonate cytidylyltransferase (CMP-KDO synthetase)
MYGFNKETILKITKLPMSHNEKKNSLEQLRWLDNNYKIKVLETDTENISIDTLDDLKTLLNKIKF